MKRLKPFNFKSILGVSFLAIGLLAGLSQTQTTQAIAGESATLFLQPSVENWAVGQIGIVDIKLDASKTNGVIGVKAYINFSDELSVSGMKADLSESQFDIIAVNRIIGNQLQLELLADEPLKGNNILVGRINFLPKVRGEARVSFDSSCQVSNQKGKNVLDRAQNGNYTIRGSKKVVLKLSPSNTKIFKGDTFNVKILLDTADTYVSGVDIQYLHFDKDKLKVKRIIPGTIFERTIKQNFDNREGKIVFSQTSAAGKYFNGSGVVATIVFQAMATGSSDIWFDYKKGKINDCNVISVRSKKDTLEEVENSDYTIIPSPRDKKGLQLKINPEGLIIIKDFVVDIEVVDANTGDIVYHNPEAVLDKNGFAPYIDLSEYPQSTYDVRVSAPFYLRQSKRITLKQGGKTGIDFDLLAGNLYDKDNVINNLDWSVMMEKWYTNDKSADINKDGQVNSLDWYYIRKNWGKEGS